MTLTNGALTSSVILFPQTKASIGLSVYYNSQPYTATLTIPDGALKPATTTPTPSPSATRT